MLLGARTAAWSGGLPYKRRIEYLIQKNCVGYFDTGITLDSTYGIWCRARRTSIDNFYGLMGSRLTWCNNCIAVYFSYDYYAICDFNNDNSHGTRQGGVDCVITPIGSHVGDIYDLVSSPSLMQASVGDEILQSCTTRSFSYFTTPTTCKVMKVDNAGSPSSGERHLFGASITHDGVKIRDYIPVVSYDNNVELFDTITKTFATRSGTFYEPS